MITGSLEKDTNFAFFEESQIKFSKKVVAKHVSESTIGDTQYTPVNSDCEESSQSEVIDEGVAVQQAKEILNEVDDQYKGKHKNTDQSLKHHLVERRFDRAFLPQLQRQRHSGLYRVQEEDHLQASSSESDCSSWSSGASLYAPKDHSQITIKTEKGEKHLEQKQKEIKNQQKKLNSLKQQINDVESKLDNHIKATDVNPQKWVQLSPKYKDLFNPGNLIKPIATPAMTTIPISMNNDLWGEQCYQIQNGQTLLQNGDKIKLADMKFKAQVLIEYPVFQEQQCHTQECYIFNKDQINTKRKSDAQTPMHLPQIKKGSNIQQTPLTKDMILFPKIQTESKRLPIEISLSNLIEKYRMRQEENMFKKVDDQMNKANLNYVKLNIRPPISVAMERRRKIVFAKPIIQHFEQYRCDRNNLSKQRNSDLIINELKIDNGRTSRLSVHSQQFSAKRL